MTTNDYPNPNPDDDTLSGDTGDSYNADAAPFMADDSTLPDNLSRFDELDIDAALAAVSSLSDLLAAEEARADAYAAEVAAQSPTPDSTPAMTAGRTLMTGYTAPVLLRLERGSPASVIPALLLLAVGAYLTFALSFTKTPPAPGLLALSGGGGIGVMLLVYSFASGRWARGALFTGWLLLFGGGSLYALTLPLPLPPGQGWLLLSGALGLALLLTGLLARPRSGRLLVIGLAVLVATGVTLIGTQGLLTANLLDLIRQSAIVIFPAALVLMLLSLIFRRQAA